MTTIKNLIMFAILIAFVLAGSITGCDRMKEPVTPTIDREGTPMTLTVYFYDTPREVTMRYREIHNIPADDPVAKRDGFAIWPEWRDPVTGEAQEDISGELECEVHTAQPRRLEDQATMILGHEILHCIYGSYHR